MVASYNVSSVVFTYVLDMLSLGHILISYLVATNLFMHSLPGMILFHLAIPFYTEGVVAWDIITFVKVHAYIK